MIHPKNVYEALTKNGITFFAGVPDSLLKYFCAYVTDNAAPRDNIITSNEGAAIALASGYHLGTGNIGAVYMQNSGQGNAINPLASLADQDVYSIPMLLIIGWRGEPGQMDEPQHMKQGKITLPLLETLDIPYEILPDNKDDAELAMNKAITSIKNRSAPYALVVKKGTFEKYKLQNKIKTDFELGREGALKLVIDHLNEKDIVVSTTGKTSRELFEYRDAKQQGHQNDFLTVGSMGHSSQIALGIALQKPKRSVFCLDGDGAFIMHTGSLAAVAQHAPKNFKHIIFNNGAHDSVGGQPTAGFDIDIPAIAKAFGYKSTDTAQTAAEITEKVIHLMRQEGPALLEIKIHKGARKDLGRPTTTPQENKIAFMKLLKER